MDQTLVSETDVWYNYAYNSSGRLDSYIPTRFSEWTHFIFTSNGKIYEKGILKTSSGGIKINDPSLINREFVLFADRDGDNDFNEYWSGYGSQVRLLGKIVSLSILI